MYTHERLSYANDVVSFQKFTTIPEKPTVFVFWLKVIRGPDRANIYRAIAQTNLSLYQAQQYQADLENGIG